MIEGFDDLNRLAVDLTGASARVVAKAGTVIGKTAADVEATAKQLAPVDTGALKNSIGWEYDHTDGLAAEIGPTVEYGAYVEFGTATMAPHAYLGPALDRHTPSFMDAMEHIAGDIL